ncbi:MAG: hypothetical protein KJO61_06890 [Deltaproteobacteria bacterium]|nr:hypothetical protein [Deltaproteobacteria bacterium]
MNIKLPIVLILGWIVINVSASADQFDPEFEGSIDTTINDISTGGLWKEGENYGKWRLIARNFGWEHTMSFLYLQWLKIDDENKSVIEFKTIPITEFNSGGWRNVIDVEYHDDAFAIHYSLRSSRGKDSQGYTQA